MQVIMIWTGHVRTTQSISDCPCVIGEENMSITGMLLIDYAARVIRVSSH